MPRKYQSRRSFSITIGVATLLSASVTPVLASTEKPVEGWCEHSSNEFVPANNLGNSWKIVAVDRCVNPTPVAKFGRIMVSANNSTVKSALYPNSVWDVVGVYPEHQTPWSSGPRTDGKHNFYAARVALNNPTGIYNQIDFQLAPTSCSKIAVGLWRDSGNILGNTPSAKQPKLQFAQRSAVSGSTTVTLKLTSAISNGDWLKISCSKPGLALKIYSLMVTKDGGYAW